jgi:hypothetical protein
MLAIVSLAALFLLGSTGCVHHTHHAAGPPPHAPAHGYRHHQVHDDVDLVWDAHLGVYAVVGFPSVYFWDGHYYRYHDDWQRGAGPRGRWEPYRGHVPPGLAKKHNDERKKSNPGKGRYR